MENEIFPVNAVFLDRNLKISKNSWNKKCSLSTKELKSKSSDFFNVKSLSYYNPKIDVPVVIRNTVPNANTQLKNVPNNNTLCKIHRK